MQADTSDPADVIHLELYVVPKSNRAEFRRRARKPMAYARKATRVAGGSGPHFYLADEQPAVRGVDRLAKLFKVKRTEDLWVEVTFYPSRWVRRTTIRQIRTTEGIAAGIEDLERLNSKRPGAWAVANASRKTI